MVRNSVVAMALVALMCGFSFGQEDRPDKPKPEVQPRIGVVEPGGKVIALPGGMWGGAGQYQFEMYYNRLAQLNMKPEFTLDKDQKQKLLDLRDEYRKAQAKYLDENRDELRKLQQAHLDALKAQDKEQIKDAQKALQDFQANGPKSDEYIDKAKALLTPEQTKVVEEQQAKEAEMRKQYQERIEKWQKEQPEGRPLKKGDADAPPQVERLVVPQQ